MKSLVKIKKNAKIILYDNFKSESTINVFLSTCLTTNKIFSDITSEVVCNRYKLKEKNKKCIFIDDQCTEQFKTCEHYDN